MVLVWWCIDFIHTQKRNPQTNLGDANAVWDFASLVPESVHQFSFLFSDRGTRMRAIIHNLYCDVWCSSTDDVFVKTGTPVSYRHMSGFSSHTFRWVNAAGESFWIKLHYKSEVGVKNFTREEAAEQGKKDADHATRDLVWAWFHHGVSIGLC